MLNRVSGRVLHQAASEMPATLSIERLGGPSVPQPWSASKLEEGLIQAARSVSAALRQYRKPMTYCHLGWDRPDTIHCAAEEAGCSVSMLYPDHAQKPVVDDRLGPPVNQAGLRGAGGL